MGKVCRELHDQARVRGGGGGVRVGSMEMGAKGAEAPPPPLQVNEIRNIHFGQKY